MQAGSPRVRGICSASRSELESGQLEATDLLWKDGLSKWEPAVDIKGLFLDSDGVGAKDAGGSNFDPDIDHALRERLLNE